MVRRQDVAQRRRARILVVEDEVDLAWVEQFNLETEGYEARVALEGTEALEAIGEFTPDLLLLDVMLPRLDGWSVLARIQELPEDQRPKVIVVSAAAGEEARQRAEQLGAGWFLAKPFDMDDLLALVSEALQPTAA
jgi:DNA-binding response OmpR family regulator